MAEPDSRPFVRVDVIYSPSPRQVVEWPLELAAGATLRDALSASVFKVFPELRSANLAVGVWAKKANLQQLLKEKDRVEVYRKLRVDPKVARRERFVRQGAKAAGLFARSRPGAKSGY
jgi:uncharacterized protein